MSVRRKIGSRIVTGAAVVGAALSLLDGGAAQAQSKGVYSGKVSLSGFYYAETDGLDIKKDDTLIPQKIATASQLGFGELRATVDARRIAKERIDFRLDVRLRFTGTYNFELKFDDSFLDKRDTTNNFGLTSRGYLGGPEYDLREAYVNVRFSNTMGLQIGRMYVNEADNIKLDAARLWRSFGPHWTGSAFVGGYPNPYSRSLLSDYSSPCGAGVAGITVGDPATSGPCAAQGLQFGLGAGAGARYSYDRLWGSVGLVGSFFFGSGDGGKVQANPAAASVLGTPMPPVEQANLQDPSGSLDSPRIFLAWLNAWRPLEKFDLFSDLVLDAYGSAGPQLTRLVLLGTVRLLPNDRLTMRIGASYMSSLAINMYLSRMVYNRLSGGTLSAQGLSFIENNLTILRTGRAEGRATLDARLIRRLGGFVEGRFRFRTLLNGGSDPDVYSDKTVYGQFAQSVAGDGSIGLRDTGSLAGLRGSLSYTFIGDYRAMNHVINFDVGRDFWNERIGVTLNYVAAITKDKGPIKGMADDACDVSSPFNACYGHRSGMAHELGLLLTLNPWRTLYVVADYRLIALTTDRQPGGVVETFPTVISHAILGRLEFRW